MGKTIFLIRGVLLGTLIVVFFCGCGKDTTQFVNSDNTSSTEYLLDSETTNTQQPDMEEQTDTKICVYVCGAIENPGVYTLSEGSRICDLFALAGGLTETAAKEFWNQASPLTDGEMIYVPTQKEVEEKEITPLDAVGTSGGAKTTEKDDGKVNINTASKEELMSIPGIGETRAEAILAYRNENGNFASSEDIMQVQGIKGGMYEKIKNYIKIN